MLHAVWNAVAHGAGDRLVSFTLMSLSYVAAGGAAALLLGAPPAAAWPHVLASAGVHVVYMLLLWASYELGDFSQTYPIARGTAPLIVVVFELAVGHHLAGSQAAGVVVISAGLISLTFAGGRPTLSAWCAAAATGVAIAGYTLIDASAVSTTPVPVYAAWMFLLQGLVIPVIAVARRGRALARQTKPVLPAGLGGGLVSILAYGLVLVAQSSGATAVVAALRETSIIIGALIGAVFLGEKFGMRRAVAAAVVAAGILLIVT